MLDAAMETDDLTPTGDAGLDDTLAAMGDEQVPPKEPTTPEKSSAERSPSHQRLHQEVRGRLFEGREPRRSLEPGTMVAVRYRIAELLGSGGMGEVFRARDLVLDEDVAVKFLPEDRANDEGFMRRFVNEVRLARQISHPSVCRVHDIGEVDGRAFISMEYIDGEDLASLLRRIGRLPPREGLRAGTTALRWPVRAARSGPTASRPQARRPDDRRPRAAQAGRLRTGGGPWRVR